jgi:hypothetical protein
MSTSKTSAKHAKTDLVEAASAGRLEEVEEILRDVVKSIEVWTIGFESISKSNTVYIDNKKLLADTAQYIINKDAIELTEEDLELAIAAAGLSASDGLSSGEDHIARIKSILSVG